MIMVKIFFEKMIVITLADVFAVQISNWSYAAFDSS
jgi:hypothetical protein